MVTPISKYFTDPENSICVTLQTFPDSGAWDWLKKNCRGLYKTEAGSSGPRDNKILFYFSDKKDAADFKIFWG